MSKKKHYQNGGFLNTEDPNKQPVTNTMSLVNDPLLSRQGLVNQQDLDAFYTSMERLPGDYITEDEYNIPLQYDPEGATYDPEHPDHDPRFLKGQFGMPQTQHAGFRGNRAQRLARSLALKGDVRTIDGKMENFRDNEGREFDRATWWDRIWGDDIDGRQAKRTVGYTPLFTDGISQHGVLGNAWDVISAGPFAPLALSAKSTAGLAEALDMKNWDPNTVQDVAEVGRSILFPQWAQKMIDPNTYNGFYPVFDPETRKWVLQETALDSEESYNKVRHALLNPYGAARQSKGFVHSLADGFSHTFGSLGSDIVNFAEMTTDFSEWFTDSIGKTLTEGSVFDGTQTTDGLTDRIASAARVNTDFHKFATTAAAKTDGLFANGDTFGNGLGSGIASLLQFWGMGGAVAKGTIKLATWGAKQMGKKAPTWAASMLGHIGGGMVINSGEIYGQAKLDGLDDDDAAMLGLSVGFINSLIEYGVGTNALANRAMGTPGANVIANAIKDYAKKTGMRISDINFLNKATAPILKKVYQMMEKGDKVLNAPFRVLENLGVRGAGSYGTSLATRGGRILSSGTEEATEEFLQHHVLEGSKWTYNYIKEVFGDETKTEGKGLFRLKEYSIKDALEESALGFMLGGGVRAITNRAYEPDIMYLISQGHGQEVLNMLGKLEGENGLGPYQYKKLYKRITDLNAKWKANEISYSYLTPKGQHLVGQLMLMDQYTGEDIAKFTKKIQQIENDNTLTPENKRKKIEDLNTRLDYKNNLKEVVDGLLTDYADPDTVKQHNLENLPHVVTQGMRLLLQDKTISQSKIRQLQNILDDRSLTGKKRLAKIRKILNKAVKAKELSKEDKDKILEEQKGVEADQDTKAREAVQRLIDLENEKIKSYDAAVESLIKDNDKWEAYDKAVQDAMDSKEESETESEKPLSKTEKEKKPKETYEERIAREKKETEDKVKKDQEDSIDALNKVNKTRFPGVPLWIKYDGGKKVGELISTNPKEADAAGKVYYILKEKDKKGNNIRVPESEVTFVLRDQSELDNEGKRHKNSGGFKTTYWLQIKPIGSDETVDLASMILTDPDLQDHLEFRFVFQAQELGNNPIKVNDNMQSNLNGSYIKVYDTRTGKQLGSIVGPNRFYDLEGNIIRGDKMSQEFFHKNFMTNRLWTDEEWDAFKNGYTTLFNMIEKLEEMYPNATEQNPEVLKNEWVALIPEVSLINNSDETQDRPLITETNLVGDHTFNGEYRIYDRQENQTLAGTPFTAEELAALPQDFDGRYFVLTKQGIVPKWIRVMPREISLAEAEKKIAALIQGIEQINKDVKDGTIKEKEGNKRIQTLNNVHKIFVAGPKGLSINVIADSHRKSGQYELKLWITHKDQSRLPNDINAVLEPTSWSNIVTIINEEIKGLGKITEQSYKQSIPWNQETGPIRPEMFESTLNVNNGFKHPTLSIDTTEKFDKLQIPDKDPKEAPSPAKSEIEKQIKKYDERDERSLKAINPDHKDAMGFHVGMKWNQGFNVIGIFKTDPDWDGEGEGYQVITKIREESERDPETGKMSKAGKYEVTIFSNKEAADKAIAAHVKKVKSLMGKKQEELRKQLKPQTQQPKKPTPKTDEELWNQELDDAFGPDAQLSLPKGNLNSAVKQDIVDQIVAQIQHELFEDQNGNLITDVETIAEEWLNYYIDGINKESFRHLKDKYDTINEAINRLRFAQREKLKLQSNKEIRKDIIDEVVARMNLLQKIEDAAEEEAGQDFDAEWTEIGLMGGMSSRVKAWLGNLSHETEDIFGRDTWQSKSYGDAPVTIRKTFDGHFLAGFIMKLASNQLDDSNVLSRLEAAAKYDDQIKKVLESLNRPRHAEIKRLVLKNFNKIELGYSIVLYNKRKNQASVVEQVQNDGKNQVINEWKSTHKPSSNNVNKIVTILTTASISEESIKNLIKAFDDIGIRMTKGGAAYLLGDQKLKRAFPELHFQTLHNPRSLLAPFKSSKQTIWKNDKIQGLANISQMFDATTYEANYRDVRNKTHYKYVNTNEYLTRVRDAQQNKERITNKFEYLPDNLLNDPNILSDMDLVRVGDYKDFDNKDGRKSNELTEKERLIVWYSLYLDGWYVPHVIADKKTSYGIKLPTKKYVVNGKITETAVEDAYKSLFLREFNRNLKEETRLIKKNDEYQYFGVLDILNDKVITNPNTNEEIKLTDWLKSLKEISPEHETFIKENVIKPMLKEVANDIYVRAKKLEALDEISKLKVGNIQIEQSVEQKLGNFAINDFIMGANFTQLIHGDNNFVDGVDFNKRLAGFNAAGTIKGKMDYKFLIIQDDIIDAYGTEAASNDAQVIMTDVGFAKRELEAGDYDTEAQKNAYEKLVKGQPLTEAEQASLDFNSTKTIYEDGNFYFKKSDNIITAEEAAQHPELGRIYKMLNDNDIMYLIAESASKRKTPKGVSSDFFSKDQKLNEELINTGSLKFERNQVVNKTKSKEGIETTSRIQKQLHDLIGHLVTGEDRQTINNINEFNAAQKETFRHLTNVLLEPENNLLLRQVIYDNAVNNQNEQTLQLLEIVDGKTMNYSLPNLKNLVETAVINLYRNGALQTTLTGGIATLASGTHYINPQTNERLTIRKDAEGIPYAEILVSKKFFNLNSYDRIEDVPPKLLTALAVRIPTQSYHSMLPVKVVGFLPNSKGDTIVTPVELPNIAGSDYDLDKLYLHRYGTHKVNGKVVPVSNEPTLQQYKNYWKQNPIVRAAQKVYKITADEALEKLGLMDMDSTTTLVHPIAAQNIMLDNLLKVFTLDEIKSEMFIPATSGQAPVFLERYGERVTKKSIFTLTGKLDFNSQNKMGATNIGIAANINSIVSMLTQFGIPSGLPSIDIDGEVYGDYTVTEETDVEIVDNKLVIKKGIRNKQDSLSSLITLFVDNVKLGLAPQVNLDEEMTQVIGHIIGVGAGQMRGLMLINQPILHHYTSLKNSDPELEGLKREEKIKKTQTIREGLIRETRRQLKGQFLTTRLTSQDLDNSLNSNLVFSDLIQYPFHPKDIKQLTKEEQQYLQVQLAVLELIDNILKDYNKLSIVVPFISAVRGSFKTKQQLNFALNKSATSTIGLLLQKDHPVYQSVHQTLNDAWQVLNTRFLDPAVVNEVFEEVYGKVTPQDRQAILKRILALKANPKYKSNIVVQRLLQIKRTPIQRADGTTSQGLRLVADSFTKMSPEIEGLMIGQFEDVINDNPGLGEDLLKYLFSTNLLGFVGESFIKYLPASVFRKFSNALDLAKLENRQADKTLKKKWSKREQAILDSGGYTYLDQQVGIPEEPEEEKLSEGEHSINAVANYFNTSEFKPLIENLEKQEVKVIYRPGGLSFYANGTIQIGELSKDVFLEEAMHAGLDILPKNEKTKLNKDVLAWYKDLVNNHGGKNELETEKLFNQYNEYYKNEEKAAEEVVAHLLRKDSILIQELNNLKSPNEQGILQSMWSKFIKIIGDILGIELNTESELARLSEILTVTNKLFVSEGITSEAEFSSEQMFSLNGKPASIFDTFNLEINPKTGTKLRLNKPAYHLEFDGRLVPPKDHIINVMQNGKALANKAVITNKESIQNINKQYNKKLKDELAVKLGYKNLEDWKANTRNSKEIEFIEGRRSGMIVTLNTYLPETASDLVSMNTIDPQQNVLNNILVRLDQQIKDLKNVKNRKFAKNREARLNKLIERILEAQDLFIATDEFLDDVTQSLQMLKDSLAMNLKNNQLIEGLNLYQNLIKDMAFIHELPKAFKDKIGKEKMSKEQRTKYDKLQEAVLKYNEMKNLLESQYIGAVSEKLFPFVEKSGKATEKYVNERIRLDKEDRERILLANITEEERQKKLALLDEQGKKYANLMELAPRSVKDLENFLRYTTQDESLALYLLTAPATTSDPGLAALVNYTYMKHNAIRNDMIEVSNKLEDAETLMKEGLKSQGRDSKTWNAEKFYEPIIEVVNNSQTGYKDVWRLVDEIDVTSFDEAKLRAMDRIRENEEAMLKLEAKWKARQIKQVDNYKKQIAKLANQIESLKDSVTGISKNPKLTEDLESVMADLENTVTRIQTALTTGVTEQELLRFGLRQQNWYKNNTIKKSNDEIQYLISRQGPNAVAWARGQMNTRAMLDQGIIDKSTYDWLIKVDQTPGFPAQTKARYFGTQVTRPNSKFTNKKWLSLYKKDKDNNWVPKNKLGEAHKMFVEIYRIQLDRQGMSRQMLDMQLPSIRKGTLDRVLERGTINELNERWTRLFTIDQDDVLDYGVAATGTSKKFAPAYFQDHIDAKDVSLDVKSSLMLFASKAASTEANNELLRTAYLLQDIYNTEGRTLDPKKIDKFGVVKLRRNVLGIKEGQSVASKRLEKYIEMVLLGKTKLSQGVDTPLGRLQIDKLVDTALSYTAITTLGMDWLKGTRNYLTAVWQQIIEAGANHANKDRLGLKDFYDGHKIMVENWRVLYEDRFQKLGNRSYLGKMLLKFDALQGNFDDFTGKQTTGNTALRQFLSTDSFLLNYHIGEVQAQGAAAIGVLKKRKVVLDGKEMALYDAYKVDSKTGGIVFKKGTKEELKKAKEIETDAINEIREMNRRLNGNYTAMSKTVLSQNAGGRLLELFRKFLMPTLLNRWRPDFINHEKGEVDGGFYLRTINNMIRAWKTSTEANILDKLRDSSKRAFVTQNDKEKAFKALHDIAWLMILSTLVLILSKFEDDDEEELPKNFYYLMYILTTTRGEIAAFAPTPALPREMLRILRSPTAMTNGITRVTKLLAQLADPFAEYERDSGVWSKGDSKLKARLLQALGFTGPLGRSVQMDPETALRNFRSTFN